MRKPRGRQLENRRQAGEQRRVIGGQAGLGESYLSHGILSLCPPLYGSAYVAGAAADLSAAGGTLATGAQRLANGGAAP
jgi:hypothetical protein